MVESAAGRPAVDVSMDVSGLLDRLAGRGLTVATAESLTGGRLAARLTAVPGSSRVYAGGVVSYATRLKTSLLGVPDEVVAEHGVVSRECAEAMAHGVRALVDADLGVATTGVAGPGPQDGVAAGTVWVAVATAAGVTTRRLALAGDRDRVQEDSCDAALSVLAGILSGEDEGLR